MSSQTGRYQSGERAAPRSREQCRFRPAVSGRPSESPHEAPQSELSAIARRAAGRARLIALSRFLLDATDQGEQGDQQQGGEGDLHIVLRISD